MGGETSGRHNTWGRMVPQVDERCILVELVDKDVLFKHNWRRRPTLKSKSVGRIN